MATANDEIVGSSISSSIWIVVLLLISCFGVFLNVLVIIGVRKNKSLSSSINELLVWICISAISEAAAGIPVKIFILGKAANSSSTSFILFSGELMSKNFSTVQLPIPCKILFGIPLLTSFFFQFLWTLISLYRLLLVLKSVSSNKLRSCFIDWKSTIFIPSLSFFLSIVSASIISYFSEPFLLYRLCLGKCERLNSSEESVAVYLTVIPAIILYLPAGLSYAIIFCLVHHARKVRRRNIKMSVPVIINIEATAIISSGSLLQTMCTDAGEPKKMRQHSLAELPNLSLLTSEEPQEAKKKTTKRLSLPTKLVPQKRGSSVGVLGVKQPRRRLSKRNLISAKLSFITMLLLFCGSGLISLTYNKVPAVQVKCLPIISFLL